MHCLCESLVRCSYYFRCGGFTHLLRSRLAMANQTLHAADAKLRRADTEHDRTATIESRCDESRCELRACVRLFNFLGDRDKSQAQPSMQNLLKRLHDEIAWLKKIHDCKSPPISLFCSLASFFSHLRFHGESSDGKMWPQERSNVGMTGATRLVARNAVFHHLAVQLNRIEGEKKKMLVEIK